MKRSRLGLAAVMVVAALVSYYGSRQVNPVTGEKQAIALSQEQEVALGLRSAPRMAAQFGGEERDPAVLGLVREVGEKLVRSGVAARTPYQYRFTALADARTVNAFALPGGPVFITRGLFDRLQNEAQLAGILGHEIGHVVGRHSAEKLAKSQLGRAIVGAIGVATSEDGRGSAAQMAAAVANQMVQLRYGREDELQSDALGVEMMTAAGYDPRTLAEVMAILASASGGRRRPEFMSSHPDPGNRSQKILGAVEKKFPQGVPSHLTTGRPLAAAAARTK